MRKPGTEIFLGQGPEAEVEMEADIQFGRMLRLRFMVAVFVLSVAGAALSLGQPAAQSAVDEKIRQADALQEKGALQDSRQLYTSLLAELRGGESSRQLGHVLNGLSNVAVAEGSYQQAIDFAQQADDVYHQLGDIEGEAYAINSRAIAEQNLGLYSAAQTSFRQALVFSQRAGDLETQVRTLNNLGNAYYFPGQYLEALRSYQDAWKIVEAHPRDKWSDYWRQITKINQATLYQRLGRYQAALQIYKEVDSSSKGLTASDRAHLLANLGVLYRRLGDPWKALDSDRAALDLYAKQHDADGEINALKNMGLVYALDQSDLDKAQQMFERALRLASETHNEVRETQSHLYLGEIRLRKRDSEGARDEFLQALAQARKLGAKEEQWKALYGQARAEERSGQPERAEVAYREAIATIETTRTQLQISALRGEFLADRRDAYDGMIALLLKKNDVKDAFLFLERSRGRMVQDRLASGGASQNVAAIDTSLDEVRSYLDNSTILLEYWVTGDQIALIWCTRESYGMAQKQLSAADLKTVLAFLKTVPANLAGDWRLQTGILGRIIPTALAPPSGMRSVLVVPDGWLSSVPFDLLPAGDGSNALLIERFSISYLPTAALLRRIKPRDDGLHMPWRHQLVAFGDPSVQPNQPAGDGLEGAASLPALPYSSEEIRSIAGMARGKAELFLGLQDLKRTFMAGKANSAALLHVSTHAFADADSPEGSRILFSPENEHVPADYVFLRELSDLDLSGVNLATLSACNTERGKMIRGEGVQAFSRALLMAGSRSALTTLWRVDDQPTSEFMKQFYYFALEKHQPKAEALRSAKLKFLYSGTRLQDPAHWASFVLNGHGLETLPRFVSWAKLLGSAALLIVLSLIAGVWLFLRKTPIKYRQKA